VKTTTGWYRFDFPETELTERDIKQQSPTAEFTRTIYRSNPMYVTFNAPETVDAGYVASATTSGDKYFGWDAKGDVTCDPPAGFGLISGTNHSSEPLADTEKKALLAPPPTGAPLANAVAIPAPGSLDCADPFSFASVTKSPAPVYPPSMRSAVVPRVVIVLVQVLVDADGKLSDAWVYSPSGRSDFDDETLRVARLATYESGTAFCKPAPGSYIFRVEFNR
jgi:TonB family protein